MSAANADVTASTANADVTASTANADVTASTADADVTASAETDSPAEPESERGPRDASRTSEEDAAAVLAILTALTAGAGVSPGATGPASVWADQAHVLRTRLHPGPGSWWASGLPR